MGWMNVDEKVRQDDEKKNKSLSLCTLVRAFSWTPRARVWLRIQPVDLHPLVCIIAAQTCETAPYAVFIYFIQVSFRVASSSLPSHKALSSHCPHASSSSSVSANYNLHALELLLLLLGEERRVTLEHVHARALRRRFPREKLLGARAQRPRLQPRGLVHGLHLDVAELADVRFLLEHGAQALRRRLLARGLGLLLCLFLPVVITPSGKRASARRHNTSSRHATGAHVHRHETYSWCATTADRMSSGSSSTASSSSTSAAFSLARVTLFLHKHTIESNKHTGPLARAVHTHT